MRPMAPSSSEYRQLPDRREPTDMEKTMRIARKKRAMSAARLANIQPIPTYATDSNERANKVEIAALQGLGSKWPSASSADSNPGNDPAFRQRNGQTVETLARPEPSPQYQANYFALMTEIDNTSSEAALLEKELLDINADIIALENANQPVPKELYAEAEQLYYKLNTARQKLDRLAREIDAKGFALRNRTTMGARFGYTTAGFGLGAAAVFGLYVLYRRRYARRGRAPGRAAGTVDPLAAFGRING